MTFLQHDLLSQCTTIEGFAVAAVRPYMQQVYPQIGSLCSPAVKSSLSALKQRSRSEISRKATRAGPFASQRRYVFNRCEKGANSSPRESSGLGQVDLLGATTISERAGRSAKREFVVVVVTVDVAIEEVSPILHFCDLSILDYAAEGAFSAITMECLVHWDGEEVLKGTSLMPEERGSTFPLVLEAHPTILPQPLVGGCVWTNGRIGRGQLA